MSTPLRRSARKVPKAKLAMDRSPSPASNKPAAKKPPARKVSTKKAASAKKAALSTDGNWGGADLGASAGMFGGRETWGPIFLMVTTPILIFFFWYLMDQCKGDTATFYAAATDPAFNVFWFQVPEGVTAPALVPNPFDRTAWTMIGGYMAFELVLQKWMPGSEFRATPSPKGNVPVYKANGMQSYLFTLATLFAGMYYKQAVDPEHWFNPSLVYDKFGELISAMNIFALVFCAGLTVKGYNWPSTSDSGKNGGGIVVDFYWGTELYPRVLGWDLKTFTNCRFGMMYWAVGICCYAYKQYEATGAVSNSMFTSVALQLVYITKFFWWETGYWCSMDIQHDRAGFYLCWGCLVWVPSVYTMQSFFLVHHPVQLSPLSFAAHMAFGVACIWTNYDCDRQRQMFRKANGKCKVWGKDPVMIEAKYTTGEGETRTSLLLACGWWAVSRHVHYVPEVLAALMWTVPGAVGATAVPYFYCVYLSILLTDRAFRDDVRCATKYGTYWEEYCALVPWKIIPGVV